MLQTSDQGARPPFLEGAAKRMLIDGQWVPARSGELLDSINPSTGEIIGQIAVGGAEDVDLAVAAARRAFEGPWSRFTPVQRQNVLLRFADRVMEHAEELPLLDTYDMGMPKSNGDHYAEMVAEIIRYYAGWTTKIHGETLPNSGPGSYFTYTVNQPVGVVASIIPWNGPFMMAVQKLVPVLATGCTTVLKPAEDASMSSLRLGELICELDLPPGVVNIVTGLGSTVGAALASHPDVDKVAFTGSTATGQRIIRAAAGNLKRVSLELGGKSPDVIFADADLGKAVPGAAMGVFSNSGQVCVAGTRVFVERPIYAEFVDRMAQFAGSLRVGDSLDPATQIGPLVSQRQLEQVTEFLEAGYAEGARAAAGGRRLLDGGLADGYFVAPTVFAEVKDEMRIAKEEIFGPVASVLPFDTVDEVVRRANSVEYGLAGGVWTRDIAKAHRVSNSLSAGLVWVNTYGNFDPAIPFGGTKMSGWGTEWGMQSLHEYLHTKSVWINTAD
jgi:aldehyde dehydrogenase (NAD+)